MPYHRILSVLVFVVAAFWMSVECSAAQAKRTKPIKKTVQPAASPEAKEPIAAAPSPEPTVKRNARPVENGVADSASNGEQRQTGQRPDPYYIYEFTQPEFVTDRITIEHDDNGTGKISFTRRGSPEVITDPLQISPDALTRLKSAYTALNFHDSTESYQYSRDYSHLGNMSISLTRGGRERVAKFNYTLNKDAKVLADEYRKISNQALWAFDITVARENQPLDGPAQMDSLESLLKRGEISDPRQMLPLLRELSDDERLPLMARNHATRIILQIEKTKK